jgi:RimJ/RimL family protein N-acetyltransferase
MPICYETSRLIVRHINMDDLDAFAALCADETALRYVGDGTTLTRPEVERWIDICQQKYQSVGFGTSAIVDKASGEFIGYCGVVKAPDRDFYEIIYTLRPDQWGKGLATEVARGMLDYVFGIADLAKIYATIHPDNVASQNIMPKLGMMFERAEEDEDGRTLVYSIARPTP